MRHLQFQVDKNDDYEPPLDHDKLFPGKDREIHKLVKEKQRQEIYLTKHGEDEANKKMLTSIVSVLLKLLLFFPFQLGNQILKAANTKHT